MAQAFPVEVPGGYWRGGERHRGAVLRSLTGADEAFLADLGPALPPVRRSTELLARTLLSLGPCRPVDLRTVGALTMGDREALLLHLRRITLGERMQLLVTCPSPTCAEPIDVDLNAGDLLLPAYGDCRPRYDLTVAGHDGPCRVVFRVPTGDDVEAAAARHPRDAAAGAAWLLRACVEEIRANDAPVEALPAAAARALPAAMAERDPQAELTLRLQCPRCALPFQVDLDAGAFLAREAGSSRLLREVHRIALHYHWSEADILGLEVGRRRAYLDLIADGEGT